MTPSHNPPEDGGVKYNPPTGGPADTAVTRWIEDRANELLAAGADAVSRESRTSGRARADDHAAYDYVGAYVRDLAVGGRHGRHSRAPACAIGVDPLGGAALACWQPIAERYGVDVEVVNDAVDPTFRFMPLDWDGRDPHGLLVALCDGRR